MLLNFFFFKQKTAYEILKKGKGAICKNALDAIQQSYDNGITDEFIQPAIVTNDAGQPLAVLQPDDVVICFNFRTDRCREITTVLTQKDMPDFEMLSMHLHYVARTIYDASYTNINIV